MGLGLLRQRAERGRGSGLASRTTFLRAPERGSAAGQAASRRRPGLRWPLDAVTSAALPH